MNTKPKPETITFNCFEGQVRLTINPGGVVGLESGLPQCTCPSCDTPDCNRSCDGSQGADDELEEDDDLVARHAFNACIDGIESLLVALAGQNVITKENRSLIETAINDAVNAAENKFAS